MILWYLPYLDPLTLFSVSFWITSPNSFLLQSPFTISTIILWYSYSLSSLVSLFPTPPPLLCLKLLISLFLHSHHPLFHFISAICYQLHSRLLLVNLIIVIYMHRGYFFMFCYFYLVFYIVKRLRVFFLDRTLYKFWYYYYYYYYYHYCIFVFCLYSSCVLCDQVAGVSGLSILDWYIGFL